MKEYTIETSCKTDGDIAHLVVLLYEGKKPKSPEDYIVHIAKWFATIDYLTKQVKLSEYRGEDTPCEEISYEESSFVDWELLDQSIAIPLALKRRIANEIEVYC